MTLFRRHTAALVSLLLAFPAAAQSPGQPGAFDYLVLALSWSPAWCEGRKAEGQCRADRRQGFVVHGLWPQYAKGGYPVECAPPGRLPETQVEAMLGVMPSAGLVRHQWKKHGTCFGGDSKAYFEATARAFARLALPETVREPERPQAVTRGEIETSFVRANLGLTPEAIAVICRNGRVSELRLCLDRNLDFKDCGPGVQDTCTGKAVLLPVTSR